MFPRSAQLHQTSLLQGSRPPGTSSTVTSGTRSRGRKRRSFIPAKAWLASHKWRCAHHGSAISCRSAVTAFTKEQLCNLECLILLRLNFHLAAPTLAFFLDYYTNCTEAAQLVSEKTGGDRCARTNPDTKTPKRCSNLARKVCELTLADYAFNKYPPSLTASCALKLGQRVTADRTRACRARSPFSSMKRNCANTGWSIEGLSLIIHYAWHLDLLTQCRPHSAVARAELTKMQRDRKVFGAICPNQMGQQEKRAAVNKKDKVLVPRSSSPVTVYVELPCIIEQAFSTIAWDDLEDCASVVRRESDFLGSQVNESDADDQDFGDYALDFMAESPATLESSLSPAELVPFEGCVIPPLTPQRYLSSENTVFHTSTEANNPSAQDGAPWKCIAQCQGRMLGDSVEVNNQLYETLHRKQEEIDSLQERNLHLRQLASRAKHLASVLEKLMTVRDPHIREPVPCGDKTSLSPCKRQRLDEGYETESSDSVEDMLRDISTRCNAVLHGTATGTRVQQESETIRMYGAFSGLQTSFSKGQQHSDGQSRA
ncbi:Multicilin [Larimichthys crocea]|uniref:Uncharacterized protein n=1 Tax=Larimichthys crocea TaxID=215358 RepID=A0ACD3Q9H6_LARCR|nr:Multicilin [Larimichthys crocea]